MKLMTTYKELLNEYYDPKRLYDKQFIVSSLQKGPRDMREYIGGLETIQCFKGNKPHVCTRINQAVYEYLFGSRY
jgi:hypothetical protein